MNSRVRTTLMLVVAAIGVARPTALHAQGAPAMATPVTPGIVLTGDWLQANALPLGRSAMPSASLTASYRTPRWTVDAGWLRIAREISTIQGGTLGLGMPIAYKRALFIPSVSALVGRAQASRDSTGYDFTTPQGTTGHQARYSYSSAATFGGGAGLAVELPLYQMLGVRADVNQWFFGGAPLENDRARTTVGVGLSVRVWR